jgi:hypothetical protein
MWITRFIKGNTVYPHVDRLCVNDKELCTKKLDF